MTTATDAIAEFFRLMRGARIDVVDATPALPCYACRTAQERACFINTRPAQIPLCGTHRDEVGA